ncbi:transglycosylase SLT domain-containing protein [Chondromyces apiculatus]|uniref:Membrane-bound lytic murein transglycosylase D n=1 Tax=Chondromyces apiculatus DSM 436 TaxID=1192034 RepID=A0A017SVL5_9BACT|nr:transglycosylase SLT domain-containing protein [Chondromyces apiculatus]EYF00351.1 Membrane-bound lytic murein transglycosylase D precursor [Chondromyces apiculatus DSM 436]
MRTRNARRFLPCAWLAALVGLSLTGVPAFAAPPDKPPAAVDAPKSSKPSAAAEAPQTTRPAAAPEALKAEKTATPAEAPQTEKASAEAAPKSAPAKPASKAPAKKPARSAAKTVAKASKKAAPKRTRKAGEPGQPDEAARRIISGTTAQQGTSAGESTELRALRDIDRLLFPAATPSPGPTWMADGTVLLDPGGPRVDASGVPPSALLPGPGATSTSTPPPVAPRDLSWLRQLKMPDIPVRWDARVVRYLEHYKNDPQGKSAAVIFLRKSGKYGAAIRRVLREQKLPEDIVWLALVESGFEPTAQSAVGAAGLWQFMPEGARIYGLTVDRWIDERLDPERATVAAARYLADLRQRFGTWELAFAAYNMGYGGLLAAIRKYNTNDFWELARLEAGLPLESALYVPKIIAISIVARNREIFGLEDVEIDPAVGFDKVAVGSGVSLQAVAAAAGSPQSEIEALNPQLVARRTPPQPLDLPNLTHLTRWEVRVPPGVGAQAAKAMPRVLEREPKLTRHLVRWGESLEDIASTHRTSRSSLQALNGLRSGEAVRPGTLLFAPARTTRADGSPEDSANDAGPLGKNGQLDVAASRPVITVPPSRFSYEDRRRVFYRVVPGDALRDIAAVLGVGLDEICRWNALDPGASLHEGMSLQAFLPKTRRHDSVLLLEEANARVLEVGSDEFFTHFEALKGRKRLEVVAREGDDWRKLSSRYSLSLGMLERINHRSRRSALQPGEKVVVYVPLGRPDEAPALQAPRERENDVVIAATTDAASDGPVKPAMLRTEAGITEDPEGATEPSDMPAGVRTPVRTPVDEGPGQPASTPAPGEGSSPTSTGQGA